MEGKIVENKKEGSSLLSRSIPLSYLSHLSHLSIYLVCLRSTTPLWFTDITKRRRESTRLVEGLGFSSLPKDQRKKKEVYCAGEMRKATS